MNGLIRKRIFPVVLSESEEIPKEVQDAFQSRSGVLSVTREGDRQRLTIEYDLMKIDARKILEVLRNAERIPSLGVLAKLHWSLIAFGEENERDNANAPAMSCCSNPDALLDRGRTQHAAHHG